MDSSKVTLNHMKIKNWIESHNGKPAKVRDVGKGVDGIIRVKFTFDDRLEEISYDEFFEIFEDNHLAFLYEDEVTSTFNKFIDRGSVSSDHFKEGARQVDLVYVEKLI